MTTIPGEQPIYQTAGKTFTLTTHRVFYHYDSGNYAETTSIMLEDLCSCSTARTNPWLLLLMAGLSLIIGIAGAMASTAPGVAVVGLGIALVLVVIYFGVRRAALVLASAGASIQLNVVSMKAPDVAQLIAQITAAKDARFRSGGR